MGNDNLLTIDFPATLNFVLYADAIYALTRKEEAGFPGFSVPEIALLPRDLQTDAFKGLWDGFGQATIRANSVACDMENVFDRQIRFRPLWSPGPQIDPIYQRIWEAFYSWWDMTRSVYNMALQAFRDLVTEWRTRHGYMRYIFLTFREIPTYLCSQFDHGLILPFEQLMIGHIPTVTRD